MIHDKLTDSFMNDKMIKSINMSQLTDTFVLNDKQMKNIEKMDKLKKKLRNIDCTLHSVICVHSVCDVSSDLTSFHLGRMSQI